MPTINPESVLPLAANDLACYALAVWPGFELARHISLLVDRLQDVERGEIRRLAVLLPPRHGKSLTSTQVFPSWYLGRHPDRSIICASYGSELAEGWGRSVRNLLAQPLQQAIFPACRFAAAGRNCILQQTVCVTGRRRRPHSA
jgi:hypothetical protein